MATIGPGLERSGTTAKHDKTLCTRGEANQRTVTVEDLQKLLIIPGHVDLLHSLTWELAEYKGLSATEVKARASQSVERQAHEWRSKDRSSRESQVSFYADNEEYLYELTKYNSTAEFAELAQVIVGFGFSHPPIHTVVDFGSGSGSLGIILASLGFEVVLTDIARPLLEFSKWRFAKRGLPARFINLLDEGPEPSSAQMVCAIDTLEHIQELAEPLARIYQWLTPGGWVLFNTFAEDEIARDQEHPMHVTSGRRIFPAMCSAGFNSRTVLHRLFGYRRPTRQWVPRSVAALSSRAYWFARWKAKNLLNLTRSRRPRPRRFS